MHKFKNFLDKEENDKIKECKMYAKKFYHPNNDNSKEAFISEMKSYFPYLSTKQILDKWNER